MHEDDRFVVDGLIDWCAISDSCSLQLADSFTVVGMQQTWV